MIAKNYIFGRKYGSALLSNLVAYYALENNANDLSGKGYNGTLFGSPTFVSGKNNLAMQCGSDTTGRGFFVTDNNDFSFASGVPFTFSIWANFSTFSSTANFLISKRGGASGSDEWQFVYSNVLNAMIFTKFEFNNNAIFQRYRSSTTPFSLNTWYHIVYTDNGSSSIGSGKLYINGSLNTAISENVGGTYTQMNNGTASTSFGYAGFNNIQELKHRGLLDEIAIWKNRELTATEIAELYNSGTGKFYPF
jgi:hypothetical protein